MMLLSAWLAGWLRVQRQWKAGYTRKVFHFLIFSTAGVCHIYGGLPVVMLFGSMVAVMVLITVWRFPESAFFKAMARPKDHPHEKWFILLPLAMTALGGLLSNLFFGAWALVGYWVAGWGDALGEPVGVKWGRHPYLVPSPGGLRIYRSLEGSLAVFTAGLLAACLALVLMDVAWPQVLWPALGCALAAVVVEALSHHGLDNLGVQLAASGVAYAWMA